jgi:ubiquinone biosynthesis protein COQ9
MRFYIQLGFVSLNRKGIFRLAIRKRLEKQLPYLDRWPQAMALGVLPAHIPETTRILGRLFDEIAHLANDKVFVFFGCF